MIVKILFFLIPVLGFALYPAICRYCSGYQKFMLLIFAPIFVVVTYFFAAFSCETMQIPQCIVPLSMYNTPFNFAEEPNGASISLLMLFVFLHYGILFLHGFTYLLPYNRGEE